MEENRVVQIRNPKDKNTVYPQTHTGCHINLGDTRYEGEHINLIPNTYKVYKYPDMNVPDFESTNYWAGGLIVTPDRKYMLIFYVGGEVAIYERSISLESGTEDYVFVAKANLASYTGNHDTHHANCASLIAYDNSQASHFNYVNFMVAISKDSKGSSNDLVFEKITLSWDPWTSEDTTYSINCTKAYTITHSNSVHYDWVVDANQNMAIGFSLATSDNKTYTVTYTGYDLSSFLDSLKELETPGSSVASDSLPKVFEPKTYKLPEYHGSQGAFILNNMFFLLTDKQTGAGEWYLYVFDWVSGNVLSRFTFKNTHEEEQEDICIVGNSIYRSVIYRTSSPKKMWVERIMLD